MFGFITKGVQYDMNFILSFSCPLEKFIEKTKVKLHVSFAMASIQGVCCVYIYIYMIILYQDEDVHMLYSGVFIHASINCINWVKLTHCYYLVLFLLLLLSSNGCRLLMHIFQIFRDINSRKNCLKDQGNDSIHVSLLLLKLKSFNLISRICLSQKRY